MGKTGGFLTPKAISNRIKAKGLQKLRWYCQMCQKQCRDANGFKCHKTSEGHLRMMKIFRENRGSILDRHSREFERGFMEIVRSRHRSKRVKANKVYQEYIADRNHLHMNATQWSSLAEFVGYLTASGKVVPDETEKGLYITYIDRDPDVIARQEAIERKERQDANEESRTLETLERMVEKARENVGEEIPEIEATELKRNPDEKVVIAFGGANVPAVAKPPPVFLADDSDSVKNEAKVVKKEEIKEEPRQRDRSHNGGRGDYRDSDRGARSDGRGREGYVRRRDNDDIRGQKRPAENRDSRERDSKRSKPTTALDDLFGTIKSAQQQREEKERIRREREERKERDQVKHVPPPPPPAPLIPDPENWILPGLIVKVMNRSVADGALYGKKGRVTKVLDLFVAVIKMIDGGPMVKVDQAQLETVIPALGSPIAIVAGPKKGHIAKLVDLDANNFSVIVETKDGDRTSYPYESVCKTDT